jgi:uncharacterized membrane protein
VSGASHPLRRTNPGVGRLMKTRNSISATLTAMFAAVYAVGVYFLAPISFLPFQVRAADALLPLAMLFGWPAIVGLSVGAFVANFFGPLGVVDIVGGALANFVATFLAWKLFRSRSRFWKLVGVAEEIAAVTLIVGTYLSYVLAQPLLLVWLGVLLGSVLAIGILGSALLFALSTDRAVNMLRSHGLVLPELASRREER